MSRLCLILVSVGLLVSFIEAQSISKPFPSEPRNPYFAAHLKRTGFYNRNSFDSNYQKNFFRRAFLPPVHDGGLDERRSAIITQNHDNRPNGVYEYVYETENGIRAQERAIPKQLRSGLLSENVEGSYAYTSPEGLQVLVEYTADEDGFHPQLSYGGVGAERFINNPEPASTIINRRH